MYTHEQVEEMMVKAMKMLDEINVPYEKDICPMIDFPKARSFYGYCCSYGAIPYSFADRARKQYHRAFKMYIRISEYTLALSEKSIMNTIIHELLHTCPGCMNHGPKWQSWGDLVRRTYGYDIKRVGGDKGEEEHEAFQKAASVTGPKIKHQVRCKSCGTVWNKTRDCNVTMHTSQYHCHCGGRLELVF